MKKLTYIDDLGMVHSINEYSEDEPCGYEGCLNHVSNPCEGCGRINGKGVYKEYTGYGGVRVKK